MKCSLGISNFLEEISSFSHSIFSLYFLQALDLKLDKIDSGYHHLTLSKLFRALKRSWLIIHSYDIRKSHWIMVLVTELKGEEWLNEVCPRACREGMGSHWHGRTIGRTSCLGAWRRSFQVKLWYHFSRDLLHKYRWSDTCLRGIDKFSPEVTGEGIQAVSCCNGRLKVPPYFFFPHPSECFCEYKEWGLVFL